MPNTFRLDNNHWIESEALEICENLSDAGFTAYLVGGCVRDFLAGVPPKDFDIVTDALPNQVKRRIQRAYVIGRRFRLVLVHRRNIQYEVATFRRNPTKEEELDEDVQNDNLFGEPEQDATRRDFTINAMFYDPSSKEVIDYVGGLDDIRHKILRVIGDPTERLIEDPIRILRALRLSHKLHFQLEENLRRAIEAQHPRLKSAALPRIREDLLKILRLPDPEKCLLECDDLGITATCFPLLHRIYNQPEMSEIFQNCLSRSIYLIEDYSDPKELFLGLSYAMLKCLSLEMDRDIWEDVVFDAAEEAFREQFGMFKSEIEFLRKNLQLLPSLQRVDQFVKRGRKRQSSFLGNESFPYALKLAHWDYYISGEAYLQWQELYRRDLDLFVESDWEKSRRRYQNRRR